MSALHRRPRRQLLDDLRLALREPNQLHLNYQPRVDLQAGQCVGVEALLRWRHPRLGLVPPGEFIPLIESDPLIVALTDWVLDQALAFAKTLPESGGRPRVSVNIAPINLTAGYFVGRLVELLGRHNVEPLSLELEFTEGALISDSRRTRQQLDQIRRLGLTIAIDDFGAGYSNLSYFDRIPADVIKIDRSLVKEIGAEQGGGTIVKWIIGLAQELGLRVVAEGVDTDQKAAALTRWQCHEAQGFAIAPPLPEANLRAWVRRYNSVRSDTVVRLPSWKDAHLRLRQHGSREET
jgi:EAL domain-containing protein (putative c-di-GMP-specific phosphodiesterase class I)